MTVYAIGDVQGCFDALQKLLLHIDFNREQDILWFAGDLVNRGPQSLETLRFVKQLGKNQRMVLGNHDLHLLAVANDVHPGWKEDTLSDILQAPDREELIDWLSCQPLLLHDGSLGFTMIHAGVAPSWNLVTAIQLAQEVESVLQDKNSAKNFLRHMYGNQPSQWDADLKGWDRLRCITNYFTRARLCLPDGSLELKMKDNKPTSDLIPWFQIPHRATKNLNIVFGHWAALAGKTHTPHAFALDTGCVWGHCLTAMRLSDQQRFSVPCEKRHYAI